MIQFDTKNQPFRDVMGNNLKYTVPRFQRDYSWGEEQWDDLWQDLHGYSESSRNTQSAHYMGYLVLQSSDGKNFIIIDGQQRLTTISIIILSALYELKKLITEKIQPEDNQRRLDTFRNRFIGFTNPVSLLTENKLTLNRNNDSFFKTYLCSLSEPPVRKLNHSEKLIREALDYFRKKFQADLSEKVPEEKGRQIAQLIDNMTDRLFFTIITVDSVANAYTVFETLNARGVQLSTPDLVKNYIFSLIDSKKQLHDQALENLESKWSNIVHQLGKHKFSDFIRVDWNSKNNFSRANELFKKIKVNLNNNEQKASDYLEGLQKNSEIYSALKDYNDEFWKHHENGLYNNDKLKLSLKTLNMFNIVAPISVLISAFHKFSASDFIKFVRYIEVISVRYNIICGHSSPSRQERAYSETARKITHSSSQSLNEVLILLKKIYPSDEEFIHDFNIKRFKTQQTNRKACYLLYRIEKFLNPSNNASSDLDSITLEHILPVKPTQDWIKELKSDEQVEEWVERIGNFTIMSRKQNKEVGGKSFKEKKVFFAKSNFTVTKKCAEYDEWNEESIAKHQRWLAKQAKSLWCLPDS